MDFHENTKVKTVTATFEFLGFKKEKPPRRPLSD